MRKVKFLVGFTVATALLFCLQNIAFAIPCGSGGVSGSSACQDGADNNDFPAPGTVNSEVFFGFDDWEYLNKYDVDEDKYDQGSAYGWTVGLGTPTTGTWSFDPSVWVDFSDVMIVLKNGGNEMPDTSDKIFFSGYLLNDGVTSGTWDSGAKALSHATLYARGGGSEPVPEPATMLLFGTGLVGLVGFRVRKKKK